MQLELELVDGAVADGADVPRSPAPHPAVVAPDCRAHLVVAHRPAAEFARHHHAPGFQRALAVRAAPIAPVAPVAPIAHFVLQDPAAGAIAVEDLDVPRLHPEVAPAPAGIEEEPRRLEQGAPVVWLARDRVPLRAIAADFPNWVVARHLHLDQVGGHDAL